MMYQDSNWCISMMEAHQQFQTLRDKFFETTIDAQSVDTKWICIFTRTPQTEELGALRKKIQYETAVELTVVIYYFDFRQEDAGPSIAVHEFYIENFKHLSLCN
jgi:hypothetical protein